MTEPLKPWRTLASKYVMKERWMTLRADTCETDEGILIDPYYVQEPGDWTHIVAFNSNYDILLIEQYRHGTGRVCIELPCGCIEPNEPPEHAIVRELEEETGCRVGRIVPLPTMSPNPARYNNRIFPFVGFDTECVAPQRLDATEQIRFKFRPLREVLGLVRSGDFSQALHTATLFLALDVAGLIQVELPVR